MLIRAVRQATEAKGTDQANGIVVITMMENFGDSNWVAMTTKIRNIAMAMAFPNDRTPRSASLIGTLLHPMTYRSDAAYYLLLQLFSDSTVANP